MTARRARQAGISPGQALVRATPDRRLSRGTSAAVPGARYQWELGAHRVLTLCHATLSRWPLAPGSRLAARRGCTAHAAPGLVDLRSSGAGAWYELLASNPEESDVQAFLELHPAMIPGGSGDIGPGGHHGSEMGAVFRRPPLKGAGRSFEPDFIWVTRSTSLITPILIEIEKPSKRWFRADGRPTQDFSAAHDQLNDWRSWFAHDENRTIFRRQFLFESQYEHRPLEPQYVLIYGRQAEFESGNGHRNPDGLRHKRDGLRAADETFMTFDSLRPRFDHSDSLTVKLTANRPRVFAVSPHYSTSTHTGAEALRLGEIADALARSVMMSEARKHYLANRWAHWAQVEQARAVDGKQTYLLQSGRE